MLAAIGLLTLTDMIIAATAMAHRLVLVTENRKAFPRDGGRQAAQRSEVCWADRGRVDSECETIRGVFVPKP